MFLFMYFFTQINKSILKCDRNAFSITHLQLEIESFYVPNLIFSGNSQNFITETVYRYQNNNLF